MNYYCLIFRNLFSDDIAGHRIICVHIIIHTFLQHTHPTFQYAEFFVCLEAIIPIRMCIHCSPNAKEIRLLRNVYFIFGLLSIYPKCFFKASLRSAEA